MNKPITLIFALFCFVTVTQGICLFGGGKYIYIYKQLNKAGESWKVSSNNVCNNLISNTSQFVSGKAGGSWTCKVYPNNNCGGTPVSLTSTGRNFGFSGRSMRCPC
jgi:hypothetical protein